MLQFRFESTLQDHHNLGDATKCRNLNACLNRFLSKKHSKSLEKEINAPLGYAFILFIKFVFNVRLKCVIFLILYAINASFYRVLAVLSSNPTAVTVFKKPTLIPPKCLEILC